MWDVDPSLLATFLKTSMKLLRDRKVVERLQELTENYTGKIKTPIEQRDVSKLGKHKKQKRCKMRMTT